MIYPFTTSYSCYAELVPCFKQNDRLFGTGRAVQLSNHGWEETPLPPF